MKRAAILIANGFEESEALVPFDLLRRGDVETDLVSVSGEPTAEGAHGLMVTGLVSITDYPFDELDCLVLPGGSAGYEALKANETVCSEARKFAADSSKILGAICASGALLGQLGLLKGRKYTCYPTMDSNFGGTYEQKHAVVDGNIVTGIGPGGSFEFGFALVRELAGREKEKQLRDATCWDLR